MQTSGWPRLDHGIGALVIHFYRGHHSYRIPFREATTQTGGDQHIPDADVGIARQMFQLQVIRTATACGNHPDIIAQYLDRQRMGSITDQQDAAGHFSHRHHLPDHAFITDNRLAFINPVVRPFINHYLIAIGV
ncbi:hypothetical protein D3C79_776990 [compost metagenome]